MIYHRNHPAWLLIAMAGAAAACLAAIPFAAHGAPPPKDSEDYQVMAPFGHWITTQHDRAGQWCCDIADGRPVDARMVTMVDADGVERTHWQAHVTPGHWDEVNEDTWLTIPDDKVVPGANPTGSAILWLRVPTRSRNLGGSASPAPTGSWVYGRDLTQPLGVYCFAPLSGA